MTNDLHRPTIHFSPPANWMNDPCGLVFHEGLFHLYYQHNPTENRWGPMHWGHAVSTDLFHWQDRPVALEPDDTHGMAFTGSAVVVDVNASATASTGVDDERISPPLRAIYTGALPLESIHATLQQQCLATSRDGDRWEPQGVVLPNPGNPDFRDPKVGRHPVTGRWYVVLAAGDHVQFFSSPDLRRWTFESRFGHGLGYANGEWECPDLFPLALPEGGSRWILVVHAGRGLANRHAGAQYITGDFDGRQFRPAEEDFRPVDRGHDFYAAQSWSGTGDRRIWIAWASHWAHSDLPQTRGWSGTMTIPRELSLVRTPDGGVTLRQQPASEFATLISEELTALPPSTQAGSHHQRTVRTWRTDDMVAYHLRAISSEPSSFRLVLQFGTAGPVTVERTPSELRVDRSSCDMGPFNALVDTDKTVPLNTTCGTVQLIVDRSVLEIFTDDGTVVTTDLLFPGEPLSEIRCEVEQTSPPVACTIHSLKPSVRR
jgi:fructan beta-fructosidase